MWSGREFAVNFTFFFFIIELLQAHFLFVSNVSPKNQNDTQKAPVRADFTKYAPSAIFNYVLWLKIGVVENWIG